MANLVYKRVSTDQQSTARQNLVLHEAGIEDPVVFEEDGGISSRLHRGQGYTLRVTAAPAIHRQLLAHCQPLDGGQGAPAVPAQRKA